MAPNFEWQAEDDLDWDALPDDPQPKPPNQKRRRWLLLLSILILIGVGAGFIYWQIERRIDENTQAMRADIVSTYNLLQIADADKDQELFFSVLSGSDSQWTAAQKNLFDAGLLQNRTPLGFSAQPAADNELDISFSPDFREAEVVSEQFFTIDIGHGLTETVVLQETAIYRLGRERWLLSPPKESFWGSQTSFSNSKVTLSTPQRDAQLGQRLSQDLQRKIDEMCRILADLQCPQDLAVEVNFSTNPASLVAASKLQAAELENGVLQVELPSPTLTGIPIDEDGYQALFRAYAAQVVSAVISHLTDFNCCRRALFHQALLHYQLDQLSLKPWPISTIEYRRLLDQQLRLSDIDALWRSEETNELDSERGWPVYAFLHYLFENYPQLSAANLQRELNDHESLVGWLDASFQLVASPPSGISSIDLIRQFWLQAYTETFAAVQNPQDLPDQTLYLTCEVQREDENTSILYKYSHETESWTENYRTSNTLFMNPLVDDSSLVLVEFDPRQRWWRTSIWQENQANPLLSDNDNHVVSFGHSDPSATNLVTFVFPPAGDDAEITLFDLQQCGADGCPSRVIPSIPIWSPDGSRLLFSDEPNAQLALMQTAQQTILFDPSADTQRSEIFFAQHQNLMEGEPVTTVGELTNIAAGHAPFWLDNQTIGYIGSNDDRFSRTGGALLMTPVAEQNIQTLLTVDDLIAVLPFEDAVRSLFWIHYAMVDPLQPDLLYVVALSGWNMNAHLFTYNIESEEIRYILHNDYSSDHTLTVSPDGRFQVMTGRQMRQPGLRPDDTFLLLHDRQNNNTIPFYIQPTGFPPFVTYDWSSGSEWLAMMLNRDLVGLFSPHDQQLLLIEAPEANCSLPAWSNG